MSDNQYFIDVATRHQAYLERLKANEVKAIKSFLEKMYNATVAEYNNGKPVSDYTLKRLNNVIDAITKVMQNGFTDFEKEWNKIISDLAIYSAEFEHKTLNKSVKYDFTLPTAKQITTAVFTNPLHISGAAGGSLVSAFYKDWTATNIKRIANYLMLGYAQGMSNQQITKNLKELGFASTGRDLELLTRTTMQHAANQARQETWNANNDIVKKVRWVSTLDSRTSSLCRSLDGTEYPIDKGPRPPGHIGCRSTTVAVLDKRFKFLEEGRERSAREPTIDNETGELKRGNVTSVSANETYYSWLKRQPASVQDSIIGKSRGKLLRNGGLTTGQFTRLQLNKNFEPMTLKEMQALEPTAFEKAGINL